MAKASAMGSAAANNGGVATVDNSDNSNNSDNSDNSGAWADGWGTSSANNGGTATTTYSVNESVLTGTVTANSVAYNFNGGSTIATSNNMTDTFNGTAVINQNVQNIGNNALTQQQVSFQGNVNVNQ
jgi:hypothetical protein